MNGIINNYYIETGFGFDIYKSTVTEIIGYDKFDRLIMGDCVFIGHWNDCKEYAKTH